MLIYIAAILLIATPIMMAEMIIGRRGRASAPSSMRNLAEGSGTSPRWSLLGWMGLFAVFLVFSFYSVIAGWTAAYLVETVRGGLSGLSPAEVGANFNTFLSEPGPMLFWHALITGSTVLIVSRGVRHGLEPMVRVLMPALLLTLIGLVVYAGFTGEFATTVNFLFKPDFALITAPVVLAAVGQAFFSVNVGIGAVVTYSAYLPQDVNLYRSAVAIALGDTLVALLAGLAIFPIVFANGLDPAEGPGLVFVTLATAFASMPGGSVIGAAFFLMLLFAALTSSISMLEMTTARATESDRLSRPLAASLLGGASFLFGIITVLSFSSWSDVHLLGAFDTFAGKTPFDLIDYLVSNVMLPLGGVGYVLFAGWWLKREVQVSELGWAMAPGLPSGWRWRGSSRPWPLPWCSTSTCAEWYLPYSGAVTSCSQHCSKLAGFAVLKRFDMQLLNESTVLAEEIDSLGHMNVRHYMERMERANRILLQQLELDPPLPADALLQRVDTYTRFQREQFEGATLHTCGGVLGLSERGMQSFVEIRNPDSGPEGGSVAATFVVTTGLQDRSARSALSFPTNQSTTAELIELPDYARPRSLHLGALATDVSLEALDASIPEVEGSGMMSGRREAEVETEDVDADGWLRQDIDVMFLPFLKLAAKTGERHGPPVLRTADGRRIGWAVMETRTLHLGTPRLGDQLAMFSADVKLETKSRVSRRWAFNRRTGALLGMSDSVGLCIDLEARKAVPWPDDLRAQIEQYLQPGLGH